MHRKELTIGIFSAGVLFLLYFGFNFLKGFNLFSKNNKYYAVFQNVDNLAVSNSVRLNGVAVGRVSHIEIMNNSENSVLVELDVSSEILLNDSSKAVLTSEFPTGRFIVMVIGHGEKVIQYGDTLRGEVAKGMLEIISENTEPVANDLQSILSKFSYVLEDLSKSTGKLNAIFSKLQETPIILNNTINKTNENINTITREFVSVTSNLNTILGQLSPVIKNFETFSDSLKQIKLNATLIEARNALEQLNSTLSQLKKDDNTIGRLLTEDSLYNNIDTFLKEASTLIIHANQYPRHFTAPFGKKHKRVMKDMENLKKDSTQNK